MDHSFEGGKCIKCGELQNDPQKLLYCAPFTSYISPAYSDEVWDAVRERIK